MTVSPFAFRLIVVAFAWCALVRGGHAAPTPKPEPFTVHVPQERLDRIQRQVREHQWGSGDGVEPWKFGMDAAWLRELGRHWASGYDWRRAEARINRFQNYRVEIDGTRLHYLLEKGSGPNPTPLVLLHGWPYSFYTFLDVIEPLAHPERFGGRVEDAFDVVVVSIPGVGFSEAPPKPESLRASGHRYHRLMTEVLGYPRYVTEGGDQGALSASWMAHDFPDAVLGHHVHMFYPRHAESPWLSGLVGANPTRAETAWVEAEKASPFGQLAYILTHVARGETLAASLQDNPVGQAAWILDKWYYWTDQRKRSFGQIYTKDHLLDEVMVYVATDTFRTSLWPYLMLGQENNATLAPGEVMANPAGVTAWPDPVFPLPPREYVERSRSHLVQYTQPEEGGHFPMAERPDLFVQDLRQFSRTLRGQPPVK